MKFHQNIHGPWTTFSEYPKEQLDMLYECYKEAAFDHKNSELEMWKVFDDYIKHRYPDWMWHLRKDCFEKYQYWEDRYKHPPDDITPVIWKEMVKKWNTSKWKVIIK